MNKKLANDPEYWKKKYAKNPERFRASAAKWRLQNPEKSKELAIEGFELISIRTDIKNQGIVKVYMYNILFYKKN
jgi:hypothetical protein